jgi:hypothetical protein
MRFLRSWLGHGSYPQRFLTTVFTTVFTTSLLSLPLFNHPVQAQRNQAQSNISNSYCFMSGEAIAQKNALLRSSLQGDRDDQNRYRAIVRQHAEQLLRCRSQNWPSQQAIWLRLYPCDVRPGALDNLLDQLVNRGYNEVYVEVFYNGQVLLPESANRTAWPSVIRSSGYEDKDLLAEAIAKGHERGLKVYAWMFTLNFGYSYSQRPEAQHVLARNGQGQTSLNLNSSSYEEVFVDPYSAQAKREYYSLVQAVVQRQPDGVLFDYIRYPRGEGSASVAGQVQDLWVYGASAQQALYQRALNPSGQELIRRFISQGYITVADIQSIKTLYPQDGEPLWQGRSPSTPLATTPLDRLQPYLQAELWQLSVAHAVQGLLDFLMLALQPVINQNIKGGAVFFPEGNQVVGQGGYDSRLQPWDRFPSTIEWHPMAYASCGNASCVVSQVQRVLAQAPAGTQIQPALAGTWGQSISNHPPLEQQMYAIRQTMPQINAVSHFAYSWQDPQSDRDRKFCQL